MGIDQVVEHWREIEYLKRHAEEHDGAEKQWIKRVELGGPRVEAAHDDSVGVDVLEMVQSEHMSI